MNHEIDLTPMTAVCTLHFSMNAVKAQWLPFNEKWPQLAGSIVKTVHLLFSLNASVCQTQTLTHKVCLLPNNNHSRLLQLKLLLQLLLLLLLLLYPSISPLLLQKVEHLVIVGGLFMAICYSCHPSNQHQQHSEGYNRLHHTNKTISSPYYALMTAANTLGCLS